MKRFFLLGLLLAAGACREQVASPDGAVDLVLQLVDDDGKTTGVQVGISTLPQSAESRRYVADIGMKKIREVDTSALDSTHAIKVKLLSDGAICFMDVSKRQIGCYGHADDQTVSYIGNGRGRGPGEVDQLHLFDVHGEHGSVMFDGSLNEIKYLDASGVEKARFLVPVNPLSAILVLNSDKMVSLNVGFAEESPFTRYEIGGEKIGRDLMSPFPSLSGRDHPYSLGMLEYGYLGRIDDAHFVYGSIYLGTFSVIHHTKGMVFTRSYIENNHGKPLILQQRPERLRLSEAGKYYYDPPKERLTRWIYNIGVATDYIVGETSYDGSVTFDFYSKADGEYQFSYAFKEKESSIMSTSFSGDKLAVLSGDGKIFVYQFDVALAGL